MMTSFRNKSGNYSGETGEWNTFSSQVQGASKVKIKENFTCFGIHIQALIREAPINAVHFHKQVEGSFRHT